MNDGPVEHRVHPVAVNIPRRAGIKIGRNSIPILNARMAEAIPIQQAPDTRHSDTMLYGMGRDPQHTGAIAQVFMSISPQTISQYAKRAFVPAMRAEPNQLVVAMPNGRQRSTLQRQPVVVPDAVSYGSLYPLQATNDFSYASNLG